MDRTLPHQRPTPVQTSQQNRSRGEDLLERRVRDEPLRTIQGELVDDELKQLKQLAWLMDESITIPGIGYKIGLDGLIGLIPGVGDLITASVSSYIIARANQMGIPRVVLLRMAGNTAIDVIIGTVPLLGDLFDIGWKANRRNLQLIVDHRENPMKTNRTSWWMVGGLLSLIVLAFVGMIAIIGASLAAIF